MMDTDGDQIHACFDDYDYSGFEDQAFNSPDEYEKLDFGIDGEDSEPESKHRLHDSKDVHVKTIVLSSDSDSDMPSTLDEILRGPKTVKREASAETIPKVGRKKLSESRARESKRKGSKTSGKSLIKKENAAMSLKHKPAQPRKEASKRGNRKGTCELICIAAHLTDI